MLIDCIKKNFNFLFEDYGFILSDDPEGNTDWVVVLVHKLFRVRFVKDRANMFVDMSFTYAPNIWYEIILVLSLMNKSQGIDDIRLKNNVGSLRSMLMKYLNELIDSINKEEFRNTISDLRSI